MATEIATIKAKFDERDFIVTEKSVNLTEPLSPNGSLLPYLNILSQTGWKAVQSRFDGWTVILDLERQGETAGDISPYMMLLLHQVQGPEGALSAAADLHTRLMNELQTIRVKEGWKILAGPKHLSSIKGLWTVTLWKKSSLGK